MSVMTQALSAPARTLKAAGLELDRVNDQPATVKRSIKEFTRALTEAVAVSPGDTVVARFDRLGSVELPCR